MGRRSIAAQLIERSLKGDRADHILDTLVSGRSALSALAETSASVLADVDSASTPLRTFFDSYGDLRFTSIEGVLVQSLSPKMTELVRLSQVEADNDALNELFDRYEGALDVLHARAFSLCGLTELLAKRRRDHTPDPERSRIARQSARAHASSRAAAARRTAVSAKGKAAHAAVGKLNARMSRH